MEKEHTILNCWCAKSEHNEEQEVRENLMRKGKREEKLDGYRNISGKQDEELLIKPF